MVDGEPSGNGPSRLRSITIQWVSGILFMLGLMGVLRRQFDGLFDAPGVSIVGLRATPFGHLLLFLLGAIGIVALKSERMGARYLTMSAAALGGLAVIGALGGENASGLGLNVPVIWLLTVLAAASAGVAIIERRRSPTL